MLVKNFKERKSTSGMKSTPKDTVFNVYTDINSSILGAILGYSILWFICIVFKLLTGKIGMGHGDFKLLAVFGAWFGWQTLTPIIILSSIIGIVAAIFLIIDFLHKTEDPLLMKFFIKRLLISYLHIFSRIMFSILR